MVLLFIYLWYDGASMIYYELRAPKSRTRKSGEKRSFGRSPWVTRDGRRVSASRERVLVGLLWCTTRLVGRGEHKAWAFWYLNSVFIVALLFCSFPLSFFRPLLVVSVGMCRDAALTLKRLKYTTNRHVFLRPARAAWPREEDWRMD